MLFKLAEHLPRSGLFVQCPQCTNWIHLQQKLALKMPLTAFDPFNGYSGPDQGLGWSRKVF